MVAGKYGESLGGKFGYKSKINSGATLAQDVF
jgi:hypothetical protein